MKKVILDTNFLLIPGQFKVDIISEIGRIMDDEYKLCIIDQTVDELKKIIEEAPPKYRAAAKIGLMVLKKNKIKKIKTEKGHVDDLIVAVADNRTVVATQDKELKARLKELS